MELLLRDHAAVAEEHLPSPASSPSSSDLNTAGLESVKILRGTQRWERMPVESKSSSTTGSRSSLIPRVYLARLLSKARKRSGHVWPHRPSGAAHRRKARSFPRSSTRVANLTARCVAGPPVTARRAFHEDVHRRRNEEICSWV
ncbi:hypothetical protein ZWY2020_030131 [Hordeum vulgare]|nr:hypothetical protein ZWY2020_030131 [Hordeum vulgare]